MSWIERDRNKENFLKLLSPSPDDRILDVGAGRGKIAAIVQKTANCEVYAVEPDPKRIEYMKSNCAKLNTCQSSAESIPFENSFFDKVYSTMAVHHFRNQRQSFKEMYRVTKAGGTLVVVDISPTTLLGRIVRFFENTILRSHLSFLDSKSLAQMLGDDCKFDIESSALHSSIYFVRAKRTLN